MGEDFYFLPKGKLLIKLPRSSPLMLRMITLVAVMMCSIYISSICLKQTTTQIKQEATRAKTIEKHSYNSRLVGLKKTEIQIGPEALSKRPIEEHSNDPIIVGLKQTETKIKPEFLRTKPIIDGLEQTEEHPYDPIIDGLEQPATQTKLQSTRTKPMEEQYDNVLKQKEIQMKSDMVSTDEQQSYDPRIIGLKQTKIQIKPESAMLKPIEQHYYVHRTVGSNQTEIEIKPELERTKLTDQHYDLRPIGLNQTKVEVKAELVRTNLTQPHCQDPGIPQSEIPYVHYPVPTKYSRKECACTPVRFYVIVSMQRSGSKWLESLLNSHVNISSYGEIFIDRERSANVSALTKTLDSVYNLDWGKGASKKFKGCTAAVGFKWMLNQGIIENYKEVSKYFKRRGVSMIFLFRRNLLRRMISLIANSVDHKELNSTHKAHVNTQHEAEILASYRPKLNAKLLVSKLKHASERPTNAMEHFKSIRHMVLYYEDLVQNNTQKLTEAMEFLRVPQRRLYSNHVKIHTRPLSLMVRNWNAVRKALKGSPYESFLTSE